MKLTYHKMVQREVTAACDWYDERKAHLGDEFFQELEQLLGRIGETPTLFPPSPYGRRKARMNRFPYAVSFRIMPDRIRILSVTHDKRHPSYGIWRK